MTLITTIPALCALVGFLIALLTTRDPLRILAYIAFGCGLLVFLMQVATKVIHI